ncbi:MAG: hypothetical protein WKF47_09475, partial [Geodermatophilaceae bacterium]
MGTTSAAAELGSELQLWGAGRRLAPMRAVALTEYGDADVMSVQELPDPLVGPDVVLVRVAAVGVNPVDYKIRQ